MAVKYSDEKLISLAPARLEDLRRRAVLASETSLVDQIVQIQSLRRPEKRPRDPATSSSPVVGFHFKCVADYEVVPAENGRFWSGVWVVRESLVQPAIDLKGYVALHSSKGEPSYRQGTIVAWRVEKRSKGKTQMGVSFLLEPLSSAFEWFGEGSGERGYRRLEDTPRYQPA